MHYTSDEVMDLARAMHPTDEHVKQRQECLLQGDNLSYWYLYGAYADTNESEILWLDQEYLDAYRMGRADIKEIT